MVLWFSLVLPYKYKRKIKWKQQTEKRANFAVSRPIKISTFHEQALVHRRRKTQKKEKKHRKGKQGRRRENNRRRQRKKSKRRKKANKKQEKAFTNKKKNNFSKKKKQRKTLVNEKQTKVAFAKKIFTSFRAEHTNGNLL